MDERNVKIEAFLEKWDEMLKAANEIEGFKWKISVSITSDNSMIPDRKRTIDGINDSFTKHNMTWSSNG